MKHLPEAQVSVASLGDPAQSTLGGGLRFGRTGMTAGVDAMI